MHAHSCVAVIATVSIVACAEPGGTARQAEAAETQPRQAIASEVVPGAQAGRMIVRPVGELRFDNVQRDVAVISGDPATGAFTALHRCCRGDSPLHWHSAGYHAVVIRGTVKHWAEGGSKENAPPLGPGSYWFQPPARCTRTLASTRPATA